MLNISARRVALVGGVLAIACVTAACGERPTAVQLGEPVILAAPATPVEQPPPITTTSDVPDPPQPSGAPVDSAPGPIDTKAIQAAAMNVEPNTTLGAVVFDRVSGAPLLSVDADRQFRSASLVKLMIAIDALNQGASEGDRGKLARMLSYSDDNLANTYWVKGGNGAIITRVVALIGLTATEPPESPGRWGEVKLTANDMVRVYQYVMTLPPADNMLIVDALATAQQHAADGWDQYFGIPDGLNLEWAVKQGWGNNDHAMVLHSTGLVGSHWRYIVVLLTEHPLGSGWRTSEQSVTAAATTLNGLLPGTGG